MNRGTAWYVGITIGRRTPALTLDQVVSFLAIILKSVLFEDAKKTLEVHRRRADIALFDAHRETIHGHELRSSQIVPVLPIACRRSR